MYGFNLWSNVVDIIKEALYNAVISVARTNKEATRILGINEQTFKGLKKKYKIREEYDIDIEYLILAFLSTTKWGVVLVSTEIKTCNGILRTAVRFRAPPPHNL